MNAIAWISVYDRKRNLVISPAIELESLGTLSISVHEAKSEVRSLGKKNVSGHTSSIRKIAGSLIFNVINYHPLKLLLQEYQNIYKDIGPWGWSKDYQTSSPDLSNPSRLSLPTALPPFNIILFGATELNEINNGSISGVQNLVTPTGMLGNYIKMFIYGIELIDDNMTFSVNNILTENTYTFIAQNIEVLQESAGAFDINASLQYDIMMREERQIETIYHTEPDWDAMASLTASKQSSSDIVRLV